ncbi:MAG: SHOCT domain-containing protein [Saprospiraceae bacterium]|nr:SHOCT domain-containing protein [Saprospiraceae bacterium]
METIFNEESIQKLQKIAEKHNVSLKTVEQLALTLLRSGGGMAQFNISELGGGGQWMKGGMTMVGDMFNNQLKARVDHLCSELSQIILNGEIKIVSPKLDVDSKAEKTKNTNVYWWGDIGKPNATGNQNDMAYAVFNDQKRLAIFQNGEVSIYDTKDHVIGGVGQQQGGNKSITFTSQKGNVRLEDLEKIVGDAEDKKENNLVSLQTNGGLGKSSGPAPSERESDVTTEDIFSKIEKLGQLKDKGFISEDEFAAKKKELLSRI